MAKLTAKKLEDLHTSFYKGVIEVKIENPLLNNTQQVDQLDQWITQSFDKFENLKRIEISTFIEKNDYHIEQYTQKLVKKFTIDLKKDTISFRFKFTGRLLQRKITFTFDESFIHIHLPKNSNLVIIQDVPLDLGEKTSYKLINFKEVEKSHLTMYENISDAVRNDVLGIQIEEPRILRPRDLMNLEHKLQVWLHEFQHLRLRYVYIQTSINLSDRILFKCCQSFIKELEEQFTTPIYFEDMSAPFSLREMKLHIRNPKLLTSESTSTSHLSFLADPSSSGSANTACTFSEQYYDASNLLSFSALPIIQSEPKSAFSGTGKVTSMAACIAKAQVTVPKDGPAPMAYLKADEILKTAKEGDLIETKESMYVLKANDTVMLQTITECFEEDPNLATNWDKLYTALGLKQTNYNDLSRNRTIGIITITDLYKHLIVSWIGQQNVDTPPTVGRLVQILRNLEFNSVADYIMEAYDAPQLT